MNLPPQVASKTIVDMFRQVLRLIAVDQVTEKSMAAERMNIEFGISCTSAVMRAAHEQALKDKHTMNAQGSPNVEARADSVPEKPEDPAKDARPPEPTEDQSFIR